MSEPSFLSGPRLIRDALIEKIRTLPLGGQVTAEVGQEVGPEVVVALLNPEGFLHFVNVPRELDVSPGVAGACLLKAEGDPVGARRRSLEALAAEAAPPVLANPHAAAVWWVASLFGPDAAGGLAVVDEARDYLERNGWRQALREPELVAGP